MAVNKPTGDTARKGAVRKRSQLETKVMGEQHWTKRSKASGQFRTRRTKASSRACARRNELEHNRYELNRSEHF
jgi:hypothetical protein